MPSRLSNLRELLQHLNLNYQVQVEVANILEDISRDIYSLDQDRSRLIADYRALESRCNSLEKRYSELLYRFSEFKEMIVVK